MFENLKFKYRKTIQIGFSVEVSHNVSTKTNKLFWIRGLCLIFRNHLPQYLCLSV